MKRIFREILHRRRVAGGGGDSARREEWLLRSRAVAVERAVSGGETLPLFRRRHFGERVLHCERIEDSRPHVGFVSDAADLLDDLSSERDPEVRVLKDIAGRIERFLLRNAFDHLFARREGEAAGPVGKVGLARQTGRMREHSADGGRRRFVECPHREPGEMFRNRIVERQLSSVAKLHHADGRKELRDRADRVERVVRRWLSRLAIRKADCAGPDDLLITHDRRGDCRDGFERLSALEPHRRELHRLASRRRPLVRRFFGREEGA